MPWKLFFLSQPQYFCGEILTRAINEDDKLTPQKKNKQSKNKEHIHADSQPNQTKNTVLVLYVS